MLEAIRKIITFLGPLHEDAILCTFRPELFLGNEKVLEAINALVWYSGE